MRTYTRRCAPSSGDRSGGPLLHAGERPYYLARKALMIHLTEDQVRALSEPHADPPRLMNPRTNETFVLLSVDEYKQLTADAYDDKPWTREELQASAWETAERAGWEGEADEAPEAQ